MAGPGTAARRRPGLSRDGAVTFPPGGRTGSDGRPGRLGGDRCVQEAVGGGGVRSEIDPNRTAAADEFVGRLGDLEIDLVLARGADELNCHAVMVGPACDT